MNNLSIKTQLLKRGDAEARRKIWSELANCVPAESSVTRSPNLPIFLRVSAPQRLKPLVHSGFNLPRRCVARNDTLDATELLLDCLLWPKRSRDDKGPLPLAKLSVPGVTKT